MSIENDLSGLSVELRKNLDSFCPTIDGLLSEFSQNPESIDNGKVIFKFFFINKKKFLI